MPDRGGSPGESYIGRAEQGLCGRRGDWDSGLVRKGTNMPRISWLPPEAGSAQRGALALSVGIVLAAFLALAVGATVYDIGKWLAVW